MTSSPLSLVLIISCLLSLAFADNTADYEFTKEKVITKLYEELNCTATTDSKDQRKITSFSCPNLTTYENTKCYLKGKTYNDGDKVPNSEVSSCTTHCVCKPPNLHCADIECPENFGRRNFNCVSQYDSINDCCRAREVCDEGKILEITKCHVEGKSYKIGEKIYPDAEPCYKCFCDEHFDNSTEIAKNSNCKKIDCGTELRDLDHLKNGCAPIYWNKRCCPIEWICPKDDDVIETSSTTAMGTCNFGKLVMKIGDKLKTNEKCTVCECAIPPYVSCVKTDC